MNNFTYTWREPLESQVERVLRHCEGEICTIIGETRQNVRGILTAYLQDEFGQSREKLRANRESADFPAPPVNQPERKQVAQFTGETEAPKRKGRAA